MSHLHQDDTDKINLHRLWTAITGTTLADKKSIYLNLFLSLFLKMGKEMDSLPELISREARSMCGQLSQEFMADIHRVATETDDESDFTKLQHYLLEGRGWKLLEIIRRIGVQNLTNTRDLVRLLKSLLPWCLKFTIPDTCSRDEVDHFDVPLISQCFCYSERTSKHKKCGLYRHHSLVSKRWRNLHRGFIRSLSDDTNPKRKYTKTVATSSKIKHATDSEDTEEKPSLNNAKEKGESLCFKQSKDAPILLRQKFFEDLKIEEEFANIEGIKQPKSPHELSSLIVILLRELCAMDSQHVSPSKMLSSSTLPELLSVLSSIYGSNEGLLCDKWTAMEIVQFQRHMLRAIFTACGIVITQQNGVNIINAHNTIATILEAASETCRMVDEHTTHPTANSSSNLHLQLACDMVFGTLMCIQSVFQNLPFNPTLINSAVNLMTEFDENKGFVLLRFIFSKVDALKSVAGDNCPIMGAIDNPVQCLSMLINTLKVTKVTYIHTIKCLKRKHRKCLYSHYFDHHHDILGVAASSEPSTLTDVPLKEGVHQTMAPPKLKCLVATWSEFLFNLIPMVTSKAFQVQLLSAAYASGVCCCMKLSHIVTPVVEALQSEKMSPSVMNHAFDILNRVLLEQFGGFFGSMHGKRDQDICPVCLIGRWSSNEHLNKHMFGHKIILQPDSGFVSSDSGWIARSSGEGLHSKWHSLALMKQLIFGKNESLATLTAKHLTLLVVKGNRSLKKELFTYIYAPALKMYFNANHEKAKDDGDKTHIPTAVMIYCLSALPFFLQVDVLMATFLKNQGLSQLSSLLAIDSLRLSVLRVFEVLIILEEYRIKQDNFKIKRMGINRQFSKASTSDSEDFETASGTVLKAFIDILVDQTQSFRRLYLEECLIGNERTQGETRTRTNSDKKDKDEAYQNHLSFIIDIWNTCRTLCISSERFLHVFGESQILPLAMGLLQSTLNCLTESCKDISDHSSGVNVSLQDSGEPTLQPPCTVFKNKLSLIEGLLVAIIACSPNKMNGDVALIMVTALEACPQFNSHHLRAVFDMLLDAAMPQMSTALEASAAQHLVLLHLREDENVDDDELLQLLHYGSDDDQENNFTETGYDADSECTISDDWKFVTRVSHKLPGLPGTSDSTIHLAAVYRLMLELLIKQHDDRQLQVYVLQQLVQTIRNSILATDVICNEGLLHLLLTGFRDVLVSESADRHEKELLLSIVQLLARHKIQAEEVKLLLQLFKCPVPSMVLLLNNLTTIVEHSRPDAHYSLSFPVLRSLSNIKPPEESIRDLLVTPLSSVSRLKTDGVAIGSFTLPRRSDSIPWFQSAWSLAPVQYHLKDLLTWPPLESGFTATIWLQMDCSKRIHNTWPHFQYGVAGRRGFQSSESLASDTSGSLRSGIPQQSQNEVNELSLHIMSVGTPDKMFEIWGNSKDNGIVLRVTSGVSEMGPVLKSSSWSHILTDGKWHHLVVTYNESLDGSTIVARTSVMLDGWLWREMYMDHPASMPLMPKSPSLFLGHMIDEDQPVLMDTWHLASMSLFKGVSCLSQEVCFHLYALGPNTSAISKCDCSEASPVLTCHLNKDLILHSAINHDVILGLKSINLEPAQESLLLTYNAQTPETVCVYDAAVIQEPMSPVNDSVPEFPVKKLVEQRPQTRPTNLLTKLCPEVNSNLEKAIEECGGIEIFIFLVAKIYEDCGSFDVTAVDFLSAEKLQSNVLHLLFTLLHQFPGLAAQYREMSGNVLLSKVLTSSRSIVGYHTLKALLDATTSESVFRFDSEGHMIMRRMSVAVVENVVIIGQLLLQWRIWEKADSSVMEWMFQALETLVREDHPYQQFNIKQFQAGNIVHKIFLIYQERIQESKPALSEVISQSVVHIVQKLMGSPPDFHLITSVCDFLLITHPAASTFITQSRASFYFNSWWGVPATPITKFNQRLANKRLQSTQSYSRELNFTNSDTPKMSTANVIMRSDSFPRRPSRPRSISLPQAGPTSYPPIAVVTQVSSDISPEVNIDHSITKAQHINVPLATDDVAVTLALDEVDSCSLMSSSQLNKGIFGSFTVISDPILEPQEINISSSSCSSSISDDVNECLPDDEESVSNEEDDSDDDQSEKGTVVLCVGLLTLLQSIVDTMPDSMLDKAFRKVLNPDVLIVLAHAPSARIRTSVVKLLGSYLHRTMPSDIEEFLRVEGFQLLASQLFQYSATRDLVEAALTIVFASDFTLDKDCDPSQFSEMTSTQQGSVVLLLALIQKTVHSTALCHNTICVLMQIFELVPTVAAIMVSNGLVETLCNLLATICTMDKRPTDVVNGDEHQILFDDIQQFFEAIAVRNFSASGVAQYQHFEDILTLLSCLQDKLPILNDPENNKRERIRDIQFQIIRKLILFIEKASNEVSQQSSGWFGPKSTVSPFSATYDIPFEDSDTVSTFTTSCESDSSGNHSYSGSKRLLSTGISRRKSSHYPKTQPAIRSKKTKLPTMLTQAELLDRVKKVIVLIMDLIVLPEKEDIKKPEGTKKVVLLFQKSKTEPTSKIRRFYEVLFDFLYKCLETTLDKGYQSQKVRNVIMWGAKDVIRVQFGRLLAFMLSPKQEFDLRVYTISYIMAETRGIDVLKLVPPSSELGAEMSVHLYELLTTWRDWLASQQIDDGYQLVNVLRLNGYVVYSPDNGNSDIKLAAIKEEKRQIEVRLNKRRNAMSRKTEDSLSRIFHKFDQQSSQNVNHAMEVTQQVNQLQSSLRKKFVNYLKRSMTDRIQVKKSWQELVQQLTHERAVWHSAESYPQSWQLDPTEGPCRVRRRLQRCHLGIKPKYLTPENQWKLGPESVDPPLIYLFEDDHLQSDSAALIYRLYTNEKIQHTCKCTAVSPASESKGDLLVGENSVYFVADEAITDANYTQVLLGNKDQLSMTWPHIDIKEIHKRWYQLRDIGVEIFLTNGKTCLLAFETTKERDQLVRHMELLDLPNFIKGENLLAIQQLWLDGRMTNFEYLTHLNKMSGRSFNDLMQYPVFPFILKDYFSDSLNIDEPESYRDLVKPIAVQEKSREKKYIENYNYLKQEYEKPLAEDEPMTVYHSTPFHYGSHYSNSGTVLHFLVRLPPFTNMFLAYQDNNFDIPDRTFHDLQTTYQLASYQSTTDVKELIPEFFFFPEFVRNNEGFDFGKRQTGETVNHVTLPPWCRNNPRLFTFIHRQALESDHVTRRISNWIDLVFGYKQKGEASVKAVNVFHPATYFGVEVDTIKEPVHRQATITMIKTYGQTPKQLFEKAPHPEPGTSQSVISQLFVSSSSSNPVSTVETRMYIPSPLKEVHGLRWGNYLGSPDCTPPVPVWHKTHDAIVASLVALPTGEVFGIGEHSCLLVMYSKERGVTAVNTTDVVWAAIISWNHPDGILRIKNKQDKPPVNFICHSAYDKITCCASLPDCRLLFTGGTAGVVTIYNTAYNSAKECDIIVRGKRKCLYGHTKPLTSLAVCRPYSILVSGSEDGTLIIWDLNRLSYVRTIYGHNNAIRTFAVSDTLGDIASVSVIGMNSKLQLHTINAEHVVTHRCEDEITCLTYSNASEGRSVNVIAGGLATGVVRLWSTWDLSPVRDLIDDSLVAKPVVSITYAYDNQRLFVSTVDGTVTLWDKHTTARNKAPRFSPFL